jgi:hypothetical protein
MRAAAQSGFPEKNIGPTYARSQINMRLPCGLATAGPLKAQFFYTQIGR